MSQSLMFVSYMLKISDLEICVKHVENLRPLVLCHLRWISQTQSLCHMFWISQISGLCHMLETQTSSSVLMVLNISDHEFCVLCVEYLRPCSLCLMFEYLRTRICVTTYSENLRSFVLCQTCWISQTSRSVSLITFTQILCSVSHLSRILDIQTLFYLISILNLWIWMFWVSQSLKSVSHMLNISELGFCVKHFKKLRTLVLCHYGEYLRPRACVKCFEYLRFPVLCHMLE